MNNAALLKDNPALDEHGRLAAEETLEAGQRGAALIRQLLAFSRRKPAEPRIFSLNLLIDEWAGLLERILGEGFSTVVELCPKAPQVRVDPAQVEQVLVNLVANARAAMPNGGKLSISTNVVTLGQAAELPAGDYVQLAVQHAGGSDRLPTPSPAGGSGLVAIWGTVEQWGGRIFVDSEAAGTRYRVLVPLAADAASPVSTRHAEPGRERPSATVLVVDDEPTLRSVIRRSLQREGYELDQRRQMIAVTLDDGRQVAVPVDQVQCRYVGNRPL